MNRLAETDFDRLFPKVMPISVLKVFLLVNEELVLMLYCKPGGLEKKEASGMEWESGKDWKGQRSGRSTLKFPPFHAAFHIPTA